ncbi:MAG: LytTR family DNA-binding domain-containing protein [bacterium]
MNDEIVKVVIIDDEKQGREIIKNLIIKNFSGLNIDIVEMADSVEKGIQAIINHRPDIVFLDIELQGGTGFDILDAFEKIDFEVIFVTAFNHYAIRAIKFAALDYLLKPVDMYELKSSIEKAIHKREVMKSSDYQITVLKENYKNAQPEMIALPTKDGYSFFKISEIIRCQAESNYTTFYFTGKRSVIIPKTLKEYEALLEEFNFCRIHSSHLINMAHVKQYLKGKGGFVIMSDGTEIEVSIRKKDMFLTKFLKL